MDCSYLLDLGSDRFRLLLLEIRQPDQNERGVQAHLLDMAELPSQGMRDGVIDNILHVIDALATLFSKIDSPVPAGDVTVVIGGSDIESYISRGVTGIDKSGGITRLEMDQALEVAEKIPLQNEREILHSIVRRYFVDGKPVDGSPIGMDGTRFEVNTHIITCEKSGIKNIIQAVNRTGYRVREIVHCSVAGNLAVLSDDERERGILLIDMGGAVTRYQCIANGTPLVTGSLNIGGFLTTNDLAVILKIPYNQAEKLKKEHGCCWSGYLDETDPKEADDNLLIGGIGMEMADTVKKEDICRILQPRVGEIFTKIREILKSKRCPQEQLAGVVLIGGGARLNGVDQVAFEIFGKTVRVGLPYDMEGMRREWKEPERVNIIGLARYIANHTVVRGKNRNPDGGRGLRSIFRLFK